MAEKRKGDGIVWYIFLFTITALIVIGPFVLLFPENFNDVPIGMPNSEIGVGGRAIGYFVGLAGGLMMLALLFYPLRKRISLFQNFGFLPTWFRWHMVLGILGPFAIIFHTTFHLGSVNAAVALVCMLLVSGSGIFGRFFYTKIHHGLYGHQSSLKEMEGDIDEAGDIKSLLAFAPTIEKKLEAFRVRAEIYAKNSKLNLYGFVAIGIEAAKLKSSVPKELLRVMLEQSASQKVGDSQTVDIAHKHLEYKTSVGKYISAVRDVAQFSTYERLFSMWHIFHIPLVYMMVFSAIYHVYAVHAY